MKAQMERRNEQLRQQIRKERELWQNADLVDIVDPSPSKQEDFSSPQQEDFTAHFVRQTSQEALTVPISDRPKKYFVPFPLSAKLGNGRMKNLSHRLTQYLQDLLKS